MRKIILILFPVFFTLVSCNDENNPNIEQSIAGKVVHSTGCKTSKSLSIENNQSCLQYVYDEVSRTLHLTHVNAGFNCCPGDISCNINMANSVISIIEKEEAAMCNCNCLFDIDIDVYQVDKAKYTIKLVEPYVGDQEILEFDIDLNNTISGEFCVERNIYPWGV